MISYTTEAGLPIKERFWKAMFSFYCTCTFF